MATFTETFERLREEFDESHENRQRLIHNLRTEVQELAEQTAEEIREDGMKRHEVFTNLMTDLREKIKDQAEHTHEALAELSNDLRHGGALLSRRPATEMDEGHHVAPKHRAAARPRRVATAAKRRQATQKKGHRVGAK